MIHFITLTSTDIEFFSKFKKRCAIVQCTETNGQNKIIINCIFFLFGYLRFLYFNLSIFYWICSYEWENKK